MPNPKQRPPKPLYRQKPPKAAPERDVHGQAGVQPGSTGTGQETSKRPKGRASRNSALPVPHSEFTTLASAHFELRDDGSIQPSEINNSPPLSGPHLIYSADAPFLRLYHGNCLELLDAIAAKYPGGRFDAIFADPPYFLSNGGITCHAGKMVKVDKGDWDKSQGPELNHEFNLEWLRRCQRVLKPNGTLWVC